MVHHSLMPIFLPVNTFSISIIGGDRLAGTVACLYNTTPDPFKKLELESDLFARIDMEAAQVVSTNRIVA